MSDNMPALPHCCDVVDNIIIIILLSEKERKLERTARQSTREESPLFNAAKFYCCTSPEKMKFHENRG